ncbi:MAG: hypothetical protein NTZ65_03605 [Candidatus Berkelbacteria bacterium]|nr:hypothetical protein [Candidatus Berkelbacteria bacterium]
MRFFAKRKFVLIVIVFLILIIGLGTVFYSTHKNTKNILAASTNKEITSQADWEAGPVTNIDSSSTPGSIKINTKTFYSINNIGTWSSNKADNPPLWLLTNVYDNDLSTVFNLNSGDAGKYVIHDYSTTTEVSKIALYLEIWVPHISIEWKYSAQYWDGGNWVDLFSDHITCTETPFECNALHGNLDTMGLTYSYIYLPDPHLQISKIRVIDTLGYMSGMSIRELTDYSGVSATHTSASTQIDGGANFWQWQTFTPTQTVTPGTTAVTYRFRSSVNGTDWTDPWSAVQTPTSGNALDISGLVTSRSGETKYRYLQVETTLSNTDGASTPTVDSYSVGYHTEVKPNKPVAQTAVIQ